MSTNVSEAANNDTRSPASDGYPSWPRREVILRSELFAFSSFADWVATAQRRFWAAGITTSRVSQECICIDAHGRICKVGKQFIRARDADAFPVTVYRI